jgi:hypothetical protein
MLLHQGIPALPPGAHPQPIPYKSRLVFGHISHASMLDQTWCSARQSLSCCDYRENKKGEMARKQPAMDGIYL